MTMATITKPGVGDTTVRLADVPLTERLNALTLALRQAADEDEALLIMALALDPGDLEARIAA